MKFDWRNFTETDYNDMLDGKDDYNGSVHVGDICIEIVVDRFTDSHGHLNEILMGNFYVAHEDTGYGYKNDILPYDYADGVDFKMPYNLSYEEFKTDAEKLFKEYMISSKDFYCYSLVEHANRPLEIW